MDHKHSQLGLFIGGTQAAPVEAKPLIINQNKQIQSRRNICSAALRLYAEIFLQSEACFDEQRAKSVSSIKRHDKPTHNIGAAMKT